MYDDNTRYVTNEELDSSLEEIKSDIEGLPNLYDIQDSMIEVVNVALKEKEKEEATQSLLKEQRVGKTMLWSSVSIGILYAMSKHGTYTDFIGDGINFVIGAGIFYACSAYIRDITR